MCNFTSRLIALCCVAIALSANAKQGLATVVLTFEGLDDYESVGDYYNGGFSGSGKTGPNFGVQFSSNALAIIDSDAGGSGNFGNEPSPNTILFFVTGNPIVNYAAGFGTGFSLYYSAISNPGSLDIYSDLDGTGTLLASLVLPTTPIGPGDPNGAFSPFVPVGVLFGGIARSVVFGGVQNQIGFDNVTFGSSTPGGAVPEPTSFAAFAIIPALAALRRRREFQKASPIKAS
jgi:hypothetical protein